MKPYASICRLCVVAVSLGWGIQSLAQDAHDHGAAAHAHEEHGSAALSLSLDHGKQWETDAALRHGMTEIRAAVDMVAPAFEAGQISAHQGHQLSEAIQGSVNTMIEQCKLPPEADANLFELEARQLASLGIAHLPQSLSEALRVMEGSELVAEALGEHVFDYFLRNKRAEWEDYRSNVTPFELRNYLSL